MSMMIGLEKGKVELYGRDCEPQLFELTPAGALELLTLVESLGTPHIMYSSSVNHPAEQGIRDDFDIDAWIQSGVDVLRDARIHLQGGFDV